MATDHKPITWEDILKVSKILGRRIKKELYFTNPMQAAKTYRLFADAGYNAEATVSMNGGKVTINLRLP